ncbi:uncharacterized protein LOC109794250 [Cajanus cajan]|uniref:uncharacterized protein LOC109794250 n=1 Tax=Cajanus cajan TaxID=3821 RepID=UPI00098DB939|nr:uncharacterized protein LOC109794250 [Cajanus cajan]
MLRVMVNGENIFLVYCKAKDVFKYKVVGLGPNNLLCSLLVLSLMHSNVYSSEFIVAEKWLTLLGFVGVPQVLKGCPFWWITKPFWQIFSSESGVVLSLYAETTSTFFMVLKSHTNSVASGQLSLQLERLHISIKDYSLLQSTERTSSRLSSNPSYVGPSRGSISTRLGSALNPKTLVAATTKIESPIEAPDSDVQEKIPFIINNVFAANIKDKAEVFAEVLKEQYYPWFAQYMVMKRLA